jgi:hypothetical protein
MMMIPELDNKVVITLLNVEEESTLKNKSGTQDNDKAKILLAT